MHSTSNGRGRKSQPAGYISGYHEPGALYMGVVATDQVPHLKSIEIEWKHNTSLFNPLTWRILTDPKIYVKKVIVEALETNERCCGLQTLHGHPIFLMAYDIYCNFIILLLIFIL